MLCLMNPGGDEEGEAGAPSAAREAESETIEAESRYWAWCGSGYLAHHAPGAPHGVHSCAGSSDRP